MPESSCALFFGDATAMPVNIWLTIIYYLGIWKIFYNF